MDKENKNSEKQENENLSSEEGTEHDLTDSEYAEDNNGKWYQSGWFWFWLVFFWPAAIYVAWFRVTSEGRKWIGITIGGVVAFAFIGGLSRSLEPGEGSISSSRQPYVEEGAVVCTSENSFDNQSSSLAQNRKSLVSGCFSTNRDIQVRLNDIGLMSGKSKVTTLDGTILWTFNEMIID